MTVVQESSALSASTSSSSSPVLAASPSSGSSLTFGKSWVSFAYLLLLIVLATALHTSINQPSRHLQVLQVFLFKRGWTCFLAISLTYIDKYNGSPLSSHRSCSWCHNPTHHYAITSWIMVFDFAICDMSTFSLVLHFIHVPVFLFWAFQCKWSPLWLPPKQLHPPFSYPPNKLCISTWMESISDACM